MNKNIADLNRGESFTADFTNGTVYTVVSVGLIDREQVGIEWVILHDDAKPVFGRSVKPALTVATVI